MGKRKYDGETDGPLRKNKKDSTEDNEQNENVESGQPQNETKLSKRPNISGFDVKHFRKEISAKLGQTMALTQFLQVCLNPDNEVDYLLEYLKSGGNSHEILRQITQDSKKNLTLATPAFHLFHLIILKVQSSVPHMIAITEEACRYFLNTFMSTVEIMISENSGPRHRKVVLKLLTSMVTLNPDLGIEVLNQAPLTPKHLQHVVETSNYKEKDNVRRAFVHFMTSFLVDGHFPLIKALLEKQGLLGLVIPGLVHDEGEAVLMFLNILKKNVVDNAFISKSLKLKTFSHQVLHNMFKIFSWKGPAEQSQDEKNELRPEIMSLLSDILLTLFTSHKLGLHFIDTSLGTADSNKNQNLYKALLTLKRPWENEHECELILQIVSKCPDLHRAIVSVLENSFEPQHSPIWERAIHFCVNLLDKLRPEGMVSRMASLNALQVTNFVRFITLPVPLLKYINMNVGKDQTISIYCIKVLVKMLQSLKRYIQILEVETSATISDLKAKLEFFFPKHMPVPGIVANLIDNIINAKNTPEVTQDYKLPKMSDTESLIYLIDLLLLYNDIQPAYFETVEGNVDMKKILDYSMSLSEGQTSLLKFKVVSLWLTLDRSAISLRNPMFKDLFLIMLHVYTSTDDLIWIEAKNTMQVYFKNTGIFESDENEIHLILYALRNAKVEPCSLVGDVIEYVLANINELADIVRNQLINFEISDESAATSLEKLFNDLMENRNTEDNTFLENKMPSPFIVGCMQYLQLYKDVKKNLKQFLSLYIANLLHSNYCPELTEVLIGDSKLDVRNYVASWIGQPVALPETLSEDSVLKNLSKSVISGEELQVNDIFTFIEKKSENGDVVNEDTYQIDTSKNVDSSELFIWSKYLVYCTVRLTNMGQLTEPQQKKITNYFQYVLSTGRNHHMIDMCRNMLLALFKNPQVLKIYTPLDSNKNSSNILATNFLLQVITENKDIIDYLDDRYKLMKSYQQKNYNEIIKAFVKINKKKNVNSEHTINVLKVVGLSKEDDMRVFNQIFGVELENCVKDDKEPSLVLELLQYLTHKYSNEITLELPQHVLKKSMKLYTDLLTNKDMSCNLTNLESSLADYFESKPHQVPRIYDDYFKKFFEVSNVRKSTAHLASVLLKYNVKFCNTFKEQIKNPDILSLRELTLPLGDAIINHNQFINENKELLTTIYNEYKSNINKFIEKPHKAGQIYVSNWKFIRKLVIECMDVEECAKIFGKSHKFETVELSHIELIQSIFLKICVHDNAVKKEFLINYFLCLLHIMTIGLKDAKEVDVLSNIIPNIFTVVQISKNIAGFNVEDKEEFKRVTESAIWQGFCKVVLKDSLKVKTVDQGHTLGPKLLSLLNILVKLFYPTDHDDIVTLFDMVTSHSEFLNVILSHHSTDIKSRLIDFLYTLMTKNNSVMKTQQIPVFLSAYHATRSPCDRLILSVLYYYESHGLPVNEYKPYVWGDSAANHYAVRKNRTSSLWAHPTPNQVLNLYEKDLIERTVRNFPVNQRLEYHYELPDFVNGHTITEVINTVRNKVFKTKNNKDVETLIHNLIVKTKWGDVTRELKLVDVTVTSHIDEDQSVYDPVFLFPLLGHLLAPGSVASCFKLLRTGLLSVPVMALSSNCPMMRAAAYHVLHRFCMLLDTETKHKSDKLFLTDFINTLRHSLASITQGIEESNRNPRLPAVDALYLARALLVSTAPADPLYRPVNNFFIAKQVVDVSVVPDFLSLFHDSEVEAVDRRLWILDVVRDGVKTMSEVNVIFKTMCLKMIMDFYSSALSDRRVKDRVICALSSIVAVPRAAEILIESYGFISWLHSVVKHLEKDRNIVRSIYALIANILNSMTVNALARNMSANKDTIELQINRNVELEIMLIVYDLLKTVDEMETEDALSYIKMYKLMSKRTRKNLNKNEMLYLVSKIGVFFDCESINNMSRALVSRDAVLLKSVNTHTFADESKHILFDNLHDVVRDYIA
ncbi:hypothetical protein O3G_MSEX006935 [Manduca sexta]|uniref:Nucleolar pre-ribosomal-associated protein 1 n=1 Tax=Manduca sexta TaxID=7130 RepID=A0A921Z472_MANSE|nr:hypothetical protein O3G_MSEX006935 [Manduca sexta]